MRCVAALLAVAAYSQGVAAEKVQGISILPPGIATGLAAKARSLQPVTLAMSPPEEDSHAVNTAIDGFLKVEQLRSKAAETAEVAQKQRLLNAEIAKIHSIVGGSSFLKQEQAQAGGHGHTDTSIPSDAAAAEAAQIRDQLLGMSSRIADKLKTQKRTSFLRGRGPMGDIIPSSDYSVNVH